MRHIYLVRHAKAEAPGLGKSDHDRALTLAGRSSASQLAAALAERGATIDLALVSSSTRTQQTWKLMAGAFSDSETQVVAALYETHEQGIVAKLAALADRVSSVAVIGHEPTISATASWLAGPGSDTDALKRVSLGMSTGTAAVLEFDGDWADLESRTTRLTGVVASKALF